MDKRVAVAFLVLLLAGLCHSQFYILEGHVIQVEVGVQGNAEISERYLLRFQNEQQLIDFRQAVNQLGVSLDAWKTYDSRVYPRIGRTDEITVNEITFVENDPEPDYLEIIYFPNEPLMEKRQETSRVVDYSIKAKFFNEFRQEQLWVIPQGTTIVVNLPKGAEVTGSVSPDATVQSNTVTWSGYASSNELQLNYSYFKEIASFDLSQLLQQLMESELFLVFVGIASVVLLALFVKRKSISNKMENYVIENSDLGSEEEE